MLTFKKIFRKQRRKIKKSLKTIEYSWQAVFIITCFSVFAYFFLEWVFLITKPSFFGSDGFLIKVNTLFFSTSITLLAIYSLMLLLYVIGILFKKRFQKICKNIVLSISAFIFSSLILLLIDNFTYVVFDFGIVSTNSSRVLYLLLFLFFCAYFFISLIPKAHDLTIALSDQQSQKWLIPILLSLTLFVSLLTARANKDTFTEVNSFTSISRDTLPNIIIITADGVDAEHMSAYGYMRETTPYIQELLDNSLIAENAFTNAGNTAGSLISIYTGKYPTDTRVLFAPDILKNQNSTEHLISILKTLNYSSTQFSYPYYADAYDLNVRSGFDFANGRSINKSGLINFLGEHFDSNQSYFIYQIYSRLLDRLTHIFYIKNMVNLSLLADGNSQGFDDQYKFEKALQILEQAESPIFIHLHWMGTHGPEYYPTIRNFSANEEISNQQEYKMDFYDDSILSFDSSVGQFIEELKKTGIYENTIFIIGSDHGEGF